ncbi:hypothetical protein JHS3_13010 [Jeongeupia sp. HS-3]|uniref:DUF1059 domain-containing protein n=1 Tax=Jeongeupia sp. HS-3 TaxID=1009682 RepID=UPI0018A3B3AC|nr:DUF1059 domain-containing protein [Jeongeupia sp. HS-3]BCL75565.1 hypothetical protein JHS3_13010 [Jeongeupia sp. HS-3]
MTRKYIDCRDYPGSSCTVRISADSEAELIEAIVEHAVKVHGHKDSPELRAQFIAEFKDEPGKADMRLAA